MTIEKLYAQLRPFFDAERCVERMRELSEMERRADFDSFGKAAAFVAGEYAKTGMQSETMHFPADGAVKYHCWTAPVGFRMRKARCEILDPVSEVLGDRDVEANTAVVGSGHTGPEGVCAEVIQFQQNSRSGQDKIRGRILFTPDVPASQLRRTALDLGAIAVISAFDGNIANGGSQVKWDNTWASAPDGWLPGRDAAEENLPGISISPEKGARLQELLAKGRVVCRIITDGEYFDGKMPAVTAFRSGEMPEYVWLSGHMFEPGLVDNASGVATAISAAEIVGSWLARRAGQGLKRGVRTFHSQECYGVLALAEYRKRLTATGIAHLNIDMVGRQEPLQLGSGLLATASFSGFLMQKVLAVGARDISGAEFRIVPEFGINCSILADPGLGGIPTCMFMQDNPCWHTSYDTYGIQALDLRILEYTVLAAAVWTLFIAEAGTVEAEWLIREMQADLNRRADAENPPSDRRIFLETVRAELRSAADLADIRDQDRLQSEFDLFLRQLRTRLPETRLEPPGSREELRQAKTLYPLALKGGPAEMRCFTEQQLQVIGAPRWSNRQLMLKAWADGKRNILDITKYVMYETGEEIPLKYTLDYFRIYTQAGLVAM